jgi:predicted RNA-binding protein associated with RNAse of E/G family
LALSINDVDKLNALLQDNIITSEQYENQYKNLTVNALMGANSLEELQ